MESTSSKNIFTSAKEIRLKGTPVSDGIAIGILYLLSNHQDEIIPEFAITSSEVEREINRYRGALSSSREDLENLQQFLAKEGSKEAISIIDTHIQMLEDPFMTTFMEGKIKQMLRNTEAVFRSVMGEYEKQFSRSEDSFFQQRLLDVKDLSKRILKHLYPRQKFSINDIPEDSIVFSLELGPSDTAEASNSRVSAFISQFGGGTSHAALIARSKGIPFVTNIDIKKLQKLNIAFAVVDGSTGEVIINPEDDTLEEYKRRKDDHLKKLTEFHQDIPSLAETKDGKKVQVLANIESIEDLELLHKYKAEGIGLFRSEFLFLQKNLRNFSEEQQFVLYKEIAEGSKGLPTVIRLFDIGGDKESLRNPISEANPALGCRAIRFLLRNRDVFRVQVRALLRAAAFGDVRILIPLISDLEELLETKAFIHQTFEELSKEGHDLPEKVLIGSMIEVPSAVITCDAIAKESDFLSIGTNDLVQYTLAADRCNPIICNMYKSTHPSIMRMIHQVIENGNQTQTPVSLCGEIASNPLYIPLLVGLGLKTLSCAPRYIPLVRRIIGKITQEEAKDLAKKVLETPTSQGVYELLSSHYDVVVRKKT